MIHYTAISRSRYRHVPNCPLNTFTFSSDNSFLALVKLIMNDLILTKEASVFIKSKVKASGMDQKTVKIFVIMTSKHMMTSRPGN